MRPNTGGLSVQGTLFNRCATVTPRRSSFVDRRYRHHRKRTGASGIVCSIKVGCWVSAVSLRISRLCLDHLWRLLLLIFNYCIIYIGEGLVGCWKGKV